MRNDCGCAAHCSRVSRKRLSIKVFRICTKRMTAFNELKTLPQIAAEIAQLMVSGVETELNHCKGTLLKKQQKKTNKMLAVFITSFHNSLVWLEIRVLNNY